MRRKKHEEHANHERWLVSYADFITLLFAFFVVMFAVSQVDSAKLGRFVESVNAALEHRGVFELAAAHPMAFAEGGIAPDRPNIRPPARPSADSLRGGAVLPRELQALAEDELLAGRVAVRIEQRGAIVSLLEVGFFESGSAEITDDALPLLERVAAALREGTTPLRFEGHADNRAIHTARFPSNWELSSARALAVLHHFESDLDFEGRRMSAGLFGEHAPISDNATARGRERNRRVDIVLLSEAAVRLEPTGATAPDEPEPSHASH